MKKLIALLTNFGTHDSYVGYLESAINQGDVAQQLNIALHDTIILNL